ncbi:MAG: hypothetical protein HUU35_03465 [Armatimonadetes bacterium]|nr:hypothetical protein [Armatimonadota bacterium]
MMLLLSLVSIAAIVCCPPTLPIWVFMLLGFATSLRPQLQARYIARHGARPPVGSRAWWRLYF